MVIKISYPITASILITLKQIMVLNVDNFLLNLSPTVILIRGL